MHNIRAHCHLQVSASCSQLEVLSGSIAAFFHVLNEKLLNNVNAGLASSIEGNLEPLKTLVSFLSGIYALGLQELILSND